MTKLNRYLKNYVGMLLVAVVLLFGQAILDLNIPNMMSNIVNTGIQKSGIAEIAPKAIPADTFQFLHLFMSEEDIATTDGLYTPFADLSANEQAKITKTFPQAESRNAMVLTADRTQTEAIDGAVGRANYAFIDFLQTMAQKNGQDVGSSGQMSADFDFEKIKEFAPMIAQMPAGSFDESIKRAQDVPATMTDAVSAVLNKAIYQDMGADTDAMQTAYIMRTGFIMFLLSFAVVACALGAGYCFSRLGAGVARDLRRDVFSKVSSFTNAEMDQFSTSSLITRTTNDITQVQTMYTMGIRMIIYAPIMGTGGVIMAIRKSVDMSWIIALAVVLIMCVIGVLYIFVMPKFKKMQTLIDRISLVARENLTGIMVIRAFGTQKFQQGRFEKANKDYTDNSLFVGRSIVTLMPIMMLIFNGITLLIIWLGSHQIANSTMQVGDMMAFMQYAMQIIMSFLFIAMVFVMMPRAAVSAERINEVLQVKSIINDPETPKTLGKNVKGVVEFKDVSFRYGGAEEDVLSQISFTAKPGETTAFIGSTGSGKSTLINLVPRFYDVTKGSITLDGVDIRDLTQHELRDHIGYVPQKGLLFSGNIQSNLRLGDETAPESLLQEAVNISQAKEFIQSMENGLETEISQGGTNVSGGQRQRLSIARALVKQAAVYIFDDSFSALDFKTDAKLRSALKPYTKDSTVLLVAQRISTIMHAEQIIVMENGKIAGIGTHEELLKNSTAYREIAESQLSKEELA